jgi:hypothetical protein
VPRLGGYKAHHQAQFVGAVDHLVHLLEKRFIGLGRVAVDERAFSKQRAVPIRVTLVKPADDVSLDDGKPLRGPVLQVFIHLLAIEPLKQ